EPLHDLPGRARIGPRFGVAHRNLPAIRERRLEARALAAIDHGHLVSQRCEVPGGRNSDHARAQDEDLHDRNYTFGVMRARLYADLLAFVRTACTHAAPTGSELPALPFYVREHIVGWLRPSFADRLRRWPHHFEVGDSFVA